MTWLQALAETLYAFGNVEPQCGRFDCCQFVATYVERLTGVDHSERFTYDDDLSAARLIVEHGGIEGLISSCLGAPRSPVALGDVVSFNIAPRDEPKEVIAVGIHLGYCSMFFDHKIGLSRTVREVRHAWSATRVG
jgi:hypothetical protein